MNLIYILSSLNFQPALFHLRLYSSLYSLYSSMRNLIFQPSFFPYFSHSSSTLIFFILPPAISPSFLCFLPIVFLLIIPSFFLSVFPYSYPHSSSHSSSHISSHLSLFFSSHPLILPALLLSFILSSSPHSSPN